MGEVLQYPLTPAQLCHPDWTLQNTPKFKQQLELEKRVDSCRLGTTDVGIVLCNIWSFGEVNLTTSLRTKRYENPFFIR